MRRAVFVVGPGRGPWGRSQAGRTRLQDLGEEAAVGAGARVRDSSCSPTECKTNRDPLHPACARQLLCVPQAEAPAAAGGQEGQWREDRRVRSRREAAGDRDAMSMEDPFFVVKG